MAFTYDLTLTGDSLAISQIRLEIGDTSDATDAGVKPDGANFADDEIQYFYDSEGDSVLGGAAHACEVLSRMWAGAGESIRIRDYNIDTTAKAKHYNGLAIELRNQSGKRFVSGSSPVTRVDGYSNDVNSRQNDASTGDYSGSLRACR